MNPRISTSLTIVIIGTTSAIGIIRNSELTKLRRSNTQLIGQAQSLSIKTEPGKSSASVIPRSSRMREVANTTSSNFLNAWKEYQEDYAQGMSPKREATRRRLIADLDHMNADQLLAIWASHPIKGDEAGFNILKNLSKKYPLEFLNCPDALQSFGVTMIPDALRRVAASDPLGALKLLGEIQTKAALTNKLPN